MSDFEKKILDYKNKLKNTKDLEETESIRTEIFGKSGFINSEFKKIGSLSVDEKKNIASNINKAKQELTKLFAEKSKEYSDLNEIIVEAKKYLSFDADKSDLEKIAELEGANVLHEKLRQIDNASADRIDYRNIRRVIRALEINHFTGRPVQPLMKTPPDFSWNIIGLDWDLSDLFVLGDRRGELMYEFGLIVVTYYLIKE